MQGLTRRLAEFVSTFDYNYIPDEAINLARGAFADTVAVIAAGIGEDVVGIVFRYAARSHASPEARVCLTETRMPSSVAALIGGTAAHALDYDDQSLSGHPSAVLVPAILAEGERLGSSGRELVAAYVAGYEVWAELIGRNSGYHSKGWHPTSVFGTIGVAAAVSFLNHLETPQTATALAIAASHASGLASNFGTMTKPLHAGLASRNGVDAARMAKAGMTAGSAVFDTDVGFLAAFASHTAPDLLSPSQVGDRFYILNHRLCVKRYPTCYFTHRSYEATLRMVSEAGIGPSDIERVEVTMGRGQTAVLTYDCPRTGLEAKFSAHFAIAAAVILGRMGLRELTDEVVLRPDIQAFFPKVKLISVDEYDARDPAHSPSDKVSITLRDGRVLDSGPISTVRGHANDPLNADELRGKFMDCMDHIGDSRVAATLFECLSEVDSLRGVSAMPSISYRWEPGD